MKHDYHMMPKEDIALPTQAFGSSLNFYVKNSWIEMRRRFCYYLLAFLSVMVVCLATVVCQSIIDSAPMIFLKAAESEVGERDIVIHPQTSENLSRPQALNYSRIRDVLQDLGQMAAPRAEFSVNVSAPFSSPKCLEEYSASEKHKIKIEHCEYLAGNLFLIDTAIEKRIELGREYRHKAAQPGKCFLQQDNARALGIKEGDTILVALNISSLSTLFIKKFNNEGGKVKISENLLPPVVVFSVEVEMIISDSSGKFEDFDHAVLMEIEGFLAYLSQFVPKLNGEEFHSFFKTQKLNEYSTQIIVNLPDRVNFFLESNYDIVQDHVTKVATKVSERLGVFPFNIELPIMEELYILRYGAMFLGIVLDTVIFILFLLSCLLLYSLLLVSIETKTFDVGVARMLGLNKTGIVVMIFIQCSSYVVPAVICGSLLSFPAVELAALVIQEYSGVAIPKDPTSKAFVTALLLSLLIPLISAYRPIQNALSQSLQQSLDISRSKISGIRITLIQSDEGFPWGRIQFAAISAGFGVSIYYLLPKALLSYDIGLLMSIFFLILIGMLLGMVILSLNIQHILEKITAWMFFWYSSLTRMLILKNLAAHRLRNRRTGIMYSLSLAFVIFLIISYTSQKKTNNFTTKIRRGCYVEVSSHNSNIPIIAYDEFVRTNLSDLVSSHSWITQELCSFAQAHGFKSCFLTHTGQIYTENPKIVGVSPNILKTSFPEFLDVDSASDSGLDPFEELYTPRGSQSLILGKSFSESLNVGIDAEDSVLAVFFNGTFTKRFELRVSAVLNNAAGFEFSKIPSRKVQSVIISLPTYKRLAGALLTSGVDEIPMGRLLLKLRGDSYSREAVDKIRDRLEVFKKSRGEDDLIRIWDFNKTFKLSENMITIIFSIVIIVVMFLCFFSLVSSMSANIMEQSKEISILRSIGITRNKLVLLFVAEAFVLVFSNSFIGLCIGTLIGYTMALQRVLFNQLPITFEFPTEELCVIILSSVLVAFASSLLPAQRLMKKEITEISRMTN